ncbi:MAG: nitrilase-related carbon-nitrogen hydrolase, partial [Planctomycetota bacterium]
MHITLVQFDIRWEDPHANFDAVRALFAARSQAAAAAHRPADELIVLPEMFANGFSLHAEKIRESFGGPSETFLADLAETEQAVVAGGWVLDNPGARPLNV